MGNGGGNPVLRDELWQRRTIRRFAICGVGYWEGFKKSIELAGWHMDAGPPSWDPQRPRNHAPDMCAKDALASVPATNDIRGPWQAP
jgi:hypothetical protein